jgi:putative tryptophan/tyrosine transport system substrate-binding protein
MTICSENRRQFLCYSGASVLVLPSLVGCEPVKRIVTRRLACVYVEGVRFEFSGFFSRLRQIALSRGTRLELDIQAVSPDAEDAMENAVDQTLSRNPDICFAPSLGAARLYARRTKTIPIVFMIWGDPIKEGLSSSLSQPSANVTGVCTGIDTSLTLLARVIAAYPHVRSLAMLRDIRDGAAAYVDTERIKDLGYAHVALKDVLPSDTLELLRTLKKQKIDAIIFGLSIGFLDIAEKITSECIRLGILAVASHSRFAKAGFHMSYQPEMPDAGARVSRMLELVLDSALVSQIPIELPEKFVFAINQTSMEKFPFRPSARVIKLADEVY